MDAIRVPKPPMLIPTMIAPKLLLKPLSNIAAGTLEIIWDRITPEITSLPIIHFLNNKLKKEMFSKLPISTKSAMNVNSK